MKILLVDDNATIRAGLHSKLKRLGVEGVVEAADGVEALETLDKQAFDLVLCDMRMPRLDGLGVLREVVGTPVVMLSNYEDEATIQLAMNAGAAGFLSYGEFSDAKLREILELVPVS
ncbi:MAG: response regulator [Propionibacteriaceae bacterium]|nr:response regulator [Propionibacteriaceae bacterium]